MLPSAMAGLTLPTGRLQPGVVFMDCDGVIFDANPIKLDAFRAAVAGAPPEAVADLLERHRATGGVSRYEKLRWFYEERCPAAEPDAAVAAALERFATEARAGYLRLAPRPEALDFAAALGGADSVYVVSGSDQEELRAVFDHHRIRHRFADVLGSPETKVPHLRRVLEARGVAPDDALMVGDGRADLEASHHLGLPFVYLREMSEWDAADEHLAPADGVAPDWATLLGWLD